ncbi:MAG TPA: hypothetical protein VML96_10415 [Egibacteraceae bacterium]|nr:hypothetical protein [Egibacteraceae bacterium]
MLEVSQTAASALDQARSAQDLPETFGVRIFGEPGPSGQVSVAMGFVEEPLEGDQVTEQAGTHIFIAPEVAQPVSDSVMDLQQTEDGPRLVIRSQEEES